MVNEPLAAIKASVMAICTASSTFWERVPEPTTARPPSRHELERLRCRPCQIATAPRQRVTARTMIARYAALRASIKAFAFDGRSTSENMSSAVAAATPFIQRATITPSAAPANTTITVSHTRRRTIEKRLAPSARRMPISPYLDTPRPRDRIATLMHDTSSSSAQKPHNIRRGVSNRRANPPYSIVSDLMEPERTAIRRSRYDFCWFLPTKSEPLSSNSARSRPRSAAPTCSARTDGCLRANTLTHE